MKKLIPLSLFALLWLTLPSGFSEEPRFTIGVLSAQSKPQCYQQWLPTALELTDQIEGAEFTILPLDYDEFAQAMKTKRVDFLISNPAVYVQAESLYGAERIATLKTSRHWEGFPFYAGTLLVQAARKDLKNLPDLRHKTIAAPNPLAFAGWIAVNFELFKHGYTPNDFFASVQFLGTDNAVVEAVRNGKVDVGSVRSGTVEKLFREGKIQMEEFNAIPPPEQNSEYTHFPFLFSTRLYPEWAFARLPHADPQLSEKIARVLLSITPDDLAAVKGDYNGWTFPRNYQSVHDCLKALKITPYQNYGKITPEAVLRSYWPVILLALFLFMLLASITAYVSHLNQSLEQTRQTLEKEINERKKTETLLRNSEQMLMRACGEMEKKVEERTDELRKKLIELERFRKATIDREFRMKEIETELDSFKNRTKK